MKMPIVKYFMLFLFYGLFFSCASSPKFTSKETAPNTKGVSTNPDVKHNPRQIKNDEKTKELPEVYYNLSESLETTSGYASYYADDFDGRQTANGETFNMYELTAAHKEYPFNTLIRVTNLSNNKTTIVRINDRGPFAENRIIDLSLGAAIQLGMVDDGVQEVRLEILEWGE